METGEKRSVKQLAGQMTAALVLPLAFIVVLLRYRANSDTLDSVFKTDIPLDLWTVSYTHL